MALFELDFMKKPYSILRDEKNDRFTQQMILLTGYHRSVCLFYDRMLTSLEFDETKIKHYSELPSLPTGLFKRLSLISTTENEAFIKTVTSSGTTNQQTSQIFLDGETRTLQQHALVAIGRDFLGEKRLPMLVIDCVSTINKRNHFSARTTGILGFSLFGRNRIFAMNEDMTLDLDAIKDFLDHYGKEPFLIFGFTYIIWQFFCMELEQQNIHLDLSNGILIHGGGWKKLEGLCVSKEIFRKVLNNCCELTHVHDYYGMAEQSGSIFMECECGHLHCSDYSGILIRNASDFSLCEKGEWGIIQSLSCLPLSYPGHSLLTEDWGRLLGEDDCPCGRNGAYFQVAGRLQNAEIRGCSDTDERV